MSLHLADKSAYEQQRHSDAADETLRALAADGALAICEIVALELLYSARSRDDYEQRWSDMQSLPWLAVTHAVMTRALSVQRQLASRGQHRLPLPDLIVAATATEHDATVLHYDRDFDLIASVTGQPTRWVIPRGSGHGRR
ncbi:MAG: PIN domain nuclease [Solirubrobacteraceae bacterium]|nr:PIN domain nuclease [Solirubrobacteraceae bacterium]